MSDHIFESETAQVILQQPLKPGEVILSKRHELGVLSNFAATPFTLRGRRYASVEGFWQAMKYPENPDDPRAQFPSITWGLTRGQVEQLTAFDAKRAGAVGQEQPNWPRGLEVRHGNGPVEGPQPPNRGARTVVAGGNY